MEFLHGVAPCHYYCLQLHQHAQGIIEMKTCRYAKCGRLFVPKTPTSMYYESKQYPSDEFCDSCTFWMPKLYALSGLKGLSENVLHDRRSFVCDGIHYTMGKYQRVVNSFTRSTLGFGGCEYLVELLDDTGAVERTMLTNNLWCQGEIPPLYREDMPDDARLHDLLDYRRRQIKEGKAVCF